MEKKYRPIKFKCHAKLQEVIEEYWEEANHARDTGRLIAWCSGLVPAEILTAMGFFNIYCTNNSATYASKGISLELCRTAEAEGFAPDLCSYPRTDIGSALTYGTAKDSLKPPKPDLLLAANGQCHTATKWIESLGAIFNVPVILIDVPFRHDNQDNETRLRARAYVKDQLQELIFFLEEYTGSPFNYDKFEEDISNSGKMFRLWQESLDLRRNIPSPLTTFDIYTHLFPLLGLRGNAKGVEYYQEFKKEVKERVANKISAIPNEKFRVFIDSVPMWFNLKGLASKFAAHGVCSLVQPYPLIFATYHELDASRPVDTTAESLLSSYLNIGIRQRIDVLVKQVEKYHLDGLVMQISRTCKGFSTGVYDILEGVEKRTKIPGITFETDMCDKRFYSEALVNNKLEAFFEMLATRS